MADISVFVPIPARRSNLRSLTFPRFGIAASLVVIPALIGDAFKMAYVAPYTGDAGRPEVAPDDDLEGRDPNW